MGQLKGRASSAKSWSRAACLSAIRTRSSAELPRSTAFWARAAMATSSRRCAAARRREIRRIRRHRPARRRAGARAHDAGALCLPQDRRGLRQPLLLLCDPQSARALPQPRHGGHPAGGAPAGRRAASRELIVVAQDTSRYGIDLYGERKLPELLRELLQNRRPALDPRALPLSRRDDRRADRRRSPPSRSSSTISTFRSSTSTRTSSKKMNRRGTRQELDALFAKIRARIPDAVFRTSLISGLPGEGEASSRSCATGSGSISSSASARSCSPPRRRARRRPRWTIPSREVAARRAEYINELQSRIMDEYNAARVGTALEVLCDGYDEENACWRTAEATRIRPTSTAA